MLLNLAEDHLDRHGTLRGLPSPPSSQAFARQGNDDVAVVPVRPRVEDLGGCARRVCFGDGREAELADRAGQLWWGEEPLLRIDEIRLRGPHNRAERDGRRRGGAGARGRPDAVARRRCATSPASPHRLEEVAERDGVLYVNDSKATNVASTLVALRVVRPGAPST